MTMSCNYLILIFKVKKVVKKKVLKAEVKQVVKKKEKSNMLLIMGIQYPEVGATIIGYDCWPRSGLIKGILFE
jgi:hypothetical protein